MSNLHRYQNRRTKWKRQTAVGIELLAEAGNLAAVQSLYRNMGYQQQPWAGFQPFAAMAMAAAAAASGGAGQHQPPPLAFNPEVVKPEDDGDRRPLVRPLPLLASPPSVQTAEQSRNESPTASPSAEIEVSDSK